MNSFITVARIVRPQGRYGEVLAELATDFPERFHALKRVILSEDEGRAGSLSTRDTQTRQFEVERSWLHKGRVVLKLAGVDSIDQANRLRGFLVMVPYGERAALPAGAYFVHELKGCRVCTQTGSEIGTVIEVEPTAGVPLLHVQNPQNKVILIPLARAICRMIDAEAKLIIIEPPGDLLELNDDAGARVRSKPRH